MDSFISFLTGLLVAIFPGFAIEQNLVFSGYVEADYVYVAPTVTGRVETIPVTDNQYVTDREVLFKQNSDQQQAALLAAQSNVKALEAALDNIRTGAREEELAVVRAQLEMAQANLKLSKLNLDRDLQLLADGIVTDAKVEQERTAFASANAQVGQLHAQLTSMELPARSAELLKAEANVDAANAEVQAAQSKLEMLTTRSPISGRIERVLYSVGEVVRVAEPVISILPDEPHSVIFYIPEERLMEFKIGDQMLLNCDGCSSGILATLEDINVKSEFTPPIIYSRDERSRLVFRAKARLPEGVSMNPGQPVSLEMMQ